MKKEDENFRNLVDCSIILGVDRVKKGHFRLQTPFLYPDGSRIDLFVDTTPDHLTPAGTLSLTDFGQTAAWLANMRIDPTRSNRRKEVLKSIQGKYNVRYNDGALEAEGTWENLNPTIIALAQACIRLADLSYTSRFPVQGKFNEELEEILSDLELEFTPNAGIEGRFGRVVHVDFLARHRDREVAIVALPALKYPSHARQQAEHTFAAFSDLVDFWPGERIAALDDRNRAYDDVDLERINTVGTVVGVFENPQLFRSILLAA